LSESSEIRDLLIEIRDNQRLSLQRQEEHLTLAKEQLERSRNQVQESITLQRQAVDRAKRISMVAIPGIILCVVLIVYLVVKYL